MKHALISISVLISIFYAHAVNTVTVKLLDTAPEGQQAEILNDNPYKTHHNLRFTREASRTDIGQIFIPARDFMMTGFCLQLSNGARPVRNSDNSKLEVAIFRY